MLEILYRNANSKENQSNKNEEIHIHLSLILISKNLCHFAEVMSKYFFFFSTRLRDTTRDV